MRTIWKYMVPVTDEFTLMLPEDARVLHVGTPNDWAPWLWAEVESTAPQKMRRFRLVGTGHPMPERTSDGTAWDYVGTFYQHGGALVWHLYQEREDLTPRA